MIKELKGINRTTIENEIIAEITVETIEIVAVIMIEMTDGSAVMMMIEIIDRIIKEEDINEETDGITEPVVVIAVEVLSK